MACRFSVNLFSRIPLSAGLNFVGALVFGVRKADLVGAGRAQPPRAVYYDWSGSPGFTICPSITQVRCWPCPCTLQCYVLQPPNDSINKL